MGRLLVAATFMALTSSVSAAEPVTEDMKRVLEYVLAVDFARSICPEFVPVDERGLAMMSEVGLEPTAPPEGSALADYIAMQWAVEETRSIETRKVEYCAISWYRFGDNGVDFPGLLKRK